jgi:signal transduction histidine kinase
VKYCLLVKIVPRRHLALIEVVEPELDPGQSTLAQDNLYYSPVRQVIEENQEFLDNNIDPNDSKFKNFFSSVDFVSCLGLPIPLLDQETDHALFLLSDEQNGFSDRDDIGRRRLEFARIGVYFLSVAIEREALLNFMYRYQEKYALGHLLGDMVHETNHKLSTLIHDVSNLRSRFASLPNWEDAGRVRYWLNAMEKEVDNIEIHSGEISMLIESFDRQAKYKYERIDVNDVVKKAAWQVKTTALEKKTTIHLDLDPALPKSVGVSLQVEQVVFNLVLNAIQMIEVYIDNLEKARRLLDLGSPLLQQGMVIVQTRCVGSEDAQAIEIRVIDNGPGIHWSQQDLIFLEDFSGRGGAGRGLSLSLNLVERMGGSLKLHNSLRFFGSVFSITLPVYKGEEPK